MNTPQRFGALDDNLKIPNVQLDRARSFHRNMDGHLRDARVASRTRLQGSLGRSTMEPPLKDIDKVIEIHPDHHADLRADPGGPQRAMALVQEALEPHLPGALFKVKKHALGIAVPDEEFGFDAVPALPTDGDDKWILIADTETHLWKPSNTYELIATVAIRNQECLGRFVHQVRMTKRAVSNAGINLPGLHTESFCYHAITGFSEHPEAVAVSLAKGAELLTGSYWEPTGVDRISDRLEGWTIYSARQGFAQLAARAQQALELAAAGDHDTAGEIWADIFGDDVFPRPSNEAKEKGYLASLWAGATVAGADHRPTPTTRAWGTT